MFNSKMNPLVVAVALAVSESAYSQQETGDPSQGSASTVLEEVLVSATRRQESIADVPYSISAISGERLTEMGIANLQDVSRLVPGLSATDMGNRGNGVNNSFVIRGTTTESTTGNLAIAQKVQVAAVSTYIDETPLFVNLQFNDLQSVEVLRGPQGTLYGSGAVGGTVRLLHNRPNTEATEFVASTWIDQVADSEDLSYGGDLIANIPVSDNFGLRFNAGYSQQAGFIDGIAPVAFDSSGIPLLSDAANPVTSGPVIGDTIEDVNEDQTWFLRVSALWQPSDTLDVLFSLHHQDDESDGFPYQTPGADREWNYPVPEQGIEREVDLAALTITKDFGFATLTSATSVYSNESDELYDFTSVLSPAFYGGFPRLTSPGFTQASDEGITQEFRLVSNGDGRLQWMAGLYYIDQEQDYTFTETVPGLAEWSLLEGSNDLYNMYYGTDFATYDEFISDFFGTTPPNDTDPLSLVYFQDRATTFEELAGFGEVSYRLTDAWEVTGGLRIFRQDYSNSAEVLFPIFAGQDNFPADVDASFDDVLFKFSTSYDVSEDIRTYFTISEGYRRGGANAYPVGDCFLCDPPGAEEYDSDQAINYELGIKQTINDRFRYAFAVYQIDWDDIQLEIGAPNSGNQIVVNGDTARTRGIEFELYGQVTDNLSAVFGFSTVEAETTADFTDPFGDFTPKGADLAGVPEQQFTLALDYSLPMPQGRFLLFHLDGSYRGETVTAINTDAPNFRELDAFTLWNASIAYDFTDRLNLRAHVRNLTDEDGITVFGGLRRGFLSPNNEFSAFEAIVRPRSVGLTLRYEL